MKQVLFKTLGHDASLFVPDGLTHIRVLGAGQDIVALVALDLSDLQDLAYAYSSGDGFRQELLDAAGAIAEELHA